MYGGIGGGSEGSPNCLISFLLLWSIGWIIYTLLSNISFYDERICEG